MTLPPDASDVIMRFLDEADIPFPESFLEFQRRFPGDTVCAAYPRQAWWAGSLISPHCGFIGDSFRFVNRPSVPRYCVRRSDTGPTLSMRSKIRHSRGKIYLRGEIKSAHLMGRRARCCELFVGAMGPAGRPWRRRSSSRFLFRVSAIFNVGSGGIGFRSLPKYEPGG